jgi:hypothetical protein
MMSYNFPDYDLSLASDFTKFLEVFYRKKTQMISLNLPHISGHWHQFLPNFRGLYSMKKLLYSVLTHFERYIRLYYSFRIKEKG